MNAENFFGGSAEVYILDTQNGDFLMDTRREKLENIYTHPQRQMRGGREWDDVIRDIIAGGTGFAVYLPDETNEWTHLYYGPAKINNWAIGITVPEKEAFSGLYAIRRVWLVIALLMTAAIALYYLWMWKDSRRDLAKAVEHAVLEEKLKKAKAAERAKTMFLSNMSHDIRTPMNAILGFATLAQTNIENQDRVKSYLARILSSGRYLLGLINDVLDMSSIENGKLNIEEKECSISDIFCDMDNIILLQMEEKQLNFSMDMAEVTDEDIYCDRLHLNQVLLNLLSNAVKFTPSGGDVSLMIRQLDDAPDGYGSYEIRVRDTGIGMTLEFAEHIFEPFEREYNSTISGIQGTGLGMAITKNIVDAMGGTIQVETEKGKGTEFIVRFMFRLQAGQAEKSAEPENMILKNSVPVYSNGRRLLLVEDNELNREIAEELLAENGFIVESVEDGILAVDTMKNSAPGYFSLILMDIQMPVMNGYDATKAIRNLNIPGVSDIPIVAMTANAFEEDRKKAFESGMDAHVAKPIDVERLLEVLHSLLAA